MQYSRMFSFSSLFLVLHTIIFHTAPLATAQVPLADFVNFEIAPVHAMDISPDGSLLAAVNTPDMRVEIFELGQGLPTPLTTIAVGLEPVSARFRDNNELWVVNNLSDSVTVIDISQRSVIRTLKTLDDPYDVVFAGSPQRAFISCSLPRMLQVFDPNDLSAAPVAIPLQGNSPRAMAVGPDGSKVHIAFFHSGNRTTIISGGMSHPDSSIINFPPDIVTHSAGPHGGVNPPPNAGGEFNPPRNIDAGTPPRVSLIVRQDASGVWRDDTGADWTAWISGSSAALSGRYPGWTLIDHDVAVVDANNLQVSYIGGMMNLCMAVDVNPETGMVAVVGTEAHNEIRFEPVINGTFIDVLVAQASSSASQASAHTDLNASLVAQFSGAPLSESERAKAIGDPRAIKWTADGSRAYIAGMGSNNLAMIDSSGQRVGSAIPVRTGPVGLALDESRDQLYVLNRFDGSISVIDLEDHSEKALVTYFDPTPTVIRTGRKHLYDTHHSSGIGHVSCASCHVDGKMDRLSWDLGAPSGARILLTSRNLNRSDAVAIPVGFGLTLVIGTGSLTHFHPMKGPMLTQTLQDIIGMEPLHWRGDRFGIEEFNDAFHELQARASGLTASEMAEFKAFLATIIFPPNPFRNLNNSLPTSLNLAGHYATGRFSLSAGAQLPNGNAVTALAQYRNKNIGSRLDQNAFACVTCHTLPTGGSTDRRWVPTSNSAGSWQPIPRGPDNENHLMVMGVSDVPGTIQNTVKVPQMRNLHERVGFHMRPGTPSLSGFGYMHDGNVASIADFIGNPAFLFQSDQQIANMVALLLSWSGSDFGVSNNGTIALEPPGVFSKDSHAAVGQQETITDPQQSLTRLNSLVSVAGSSQRLELVAKSYGNGVSRGYLLSQGTNFIADLPGEQISQAELVAATGEGRSVTFTVVPAGTGYRLGLDRDMDGYLDYEEVLNCTDPNDPNSYGECQCAEVADSFVYHDGWTGPGSPIDPFKIVHRETDTPTQLTIENLINSSTGITGVGFDVDRLANPTAITAADFSFQMSPLGAFSQQSDPAVDWDAAPAPISVTVTEGSPEQIMIRWEPNQITDRWLRIVIKANGRTGFANDEVFYIGHLLGETSEENNGMFSVSFTDIMAIRDGVGSNVDSGSMLDIDKNGTITFSDIAAMRASVGKQLTAISVPASGQ
jgi:YVTN family beta-propeller protein